MRAAQRRADVRIRVARVDHMVLEALKSVDLSKLAAIPESVFQAGTSEIKNWITVAGIMTEMP